MLTIRRIAAVATLLAILIVLAITFRQPSRPTAPNFFTDPTGATCQCLFGIKPGITTRIEAERLLRNQPSIEVFSITQHPLFDDVSLNQSAISLWINSNNIVDNIEFDMYDSHPTVTLEQATAPLGKPSQIGVAATGSGWIFDKDGVVVSTYQKLAPTSRVWTIRVNKPGEPSITWMPDELHPTTGTQ